MVVLAALSSCKPKEANVEEGSSFTGFDPEWLATDVTACQDFAEYTSAGWKEQYPIPSTEGRWGSFNLLIEENNQKIKVLLSDLVEGDYSKGTYQQQIKDFYSTALDTNRIEEIGSSELEKVLGLYESMDEVTELPMVFAEMKKRGVKTPFSTYVSADDKRSTHNIFQISQSGIGMPDRDYYLKDDEKSISIREEYLKHIQLVLELAKIEDASAKAVAIMNLETEMAKMHMSRSDRRIPELTYHKVSTDEFKSWLPSFDVSGLFDVIGYSGDTLLCSQTDYIKGLDNLFSSVDLETWRAYCQWHSLRRYQVALPAAFREAHFNFFGRKLKGLESPKPRWKVALSSLQEGQSESLGRIYVDKYFPESYKNRIAEMVENIKATYAERIDQLSWMSDETKGKAKEKLAAITYKIGYPDTWKDYSSMDISPNSMIDNMLQVSLYRIKENMAKVDQPVDKTEWFMGAHIVNAYYKPSYNEIVFPAGILQAPFFSPDADDAMNYGAIGGVIGHEFTHGFDDQGSKYDKSGNLENWWTEEDRMEFEKLANQLVEQYNSFEALPGEFVNGQMTLGENIADLGGLTIAYYAYKRSIKLEDEPELIDGFTDDQRFFLGWAGVWQVHYKEEALRDRLLTDYHSPGNFRVQGPIQNMKEFEMAYECTDGNGFVLPDSSKVAIW